MAVHFMADPHFGQQSILRLCNRPFSTIEEMHEVFLDNINKRVKPGDDLRILGDFCTKSFAQAKEIRDRIKCRNVHLIWGNHDRKGYAKLFKTAEYFAKISVNGQTIVLFHYAMMTWEHNYKDTIHLYGHSHRNLEAFADRVMPNRRSMDVGVDNLYHILGEYRPISFDEVMGILGDRKFVPPDIVGFPEDWEEKEDNDSEDRTEGIPEIST